MSKRKYTKIQMLLPVIEGMIAEGMSHREIEKELGLEGDRPIHNLLKRQRRKAANEKPKYRGRKPAKTLQEYKYENLLNREFQADRPNHKWVTDISYIHTGQGVLYLSVIRDLFDNSIVAYKTGTNQSVNLVLDTIRLAMQTEKKVAAELQLHRSEEHTSELQSLQ